MLGLEGAAERRRVVLAVVVLAMVVVVVMVVGVDRGKRNPICWSNKGGSE